MTTSRNDPAFEPLQGWREYPPAEMEARARAFAAEMQRRRTTRHFSDRPVPRAVIEACLEAASTAPSGAHLPASGAGSSWRSACSRSAG
jgi:hypothetical protein